MRAVKASIGHHTGEVRRAARSWAREASILARETRHLGQGLRACEPALRTTSCLRVALPGGSMS